MLESIRRFNKAVSIVAVAGWPVAVSAQNQSLDFAQVDISSDTKTGVVVKALHGLAQPNPDPLLSAAYTKWTDGWSANVGGVYRWALTSGDHKWLLRAGAGVDRFVGVDGDKNAISARAQTELSGPAPGGSYYALAQASTFRHGFLGLGQYSIANTPIAFEASYYTETSHHHTTLAAMYALDSKKQWFVRAGAILSDRDRPFIGIAYNGF